MSKFKYKKSALITVAVLLLIGFAITGSVLNIVKIVQSTGDALKVLGYCIALAICLLTLVCAMGVMFFSSYTVNSDYVTVRYGIFYEKIKAAAITGVTVFKKTDALVIYYGNNKYQVILTDVENYDNFINALLEVNPDVAYDVRHTD